MHDAPSALKRSLGAALERLEATNPADAELLRAYVKATRAEAAGYRIRLRKATEQLGQMEQPR